MYSLYNALLTQHSRQLTSVRCAEQTIAQLQRYFEDVVLENSLSALVVESLPLKAERTLRELSRIREVGRAAHRAFVFVSQGDALNEMPLRMSERDREPVLLQRGERDLADERFVVIADARFSGLLASVHREEDDGSYEGGDDVIWTFEPDIVYSALEYLMARLRAERHPHAFSFQNTVHASMPKATSLQLTVGVTTKLARLLQEQAGREIAINRIATAIRSSLEIGSILQTTVNELGRALKLQHCALRVEGEAGGKPLAHCYFRDGAEEGSTEETELLNNVDAYAARVSRNNESYVLDGHVTTAGLGQNIQPLAAVPLVYDERFMGLLLAISDDTARVWQESEVMLLHTVADQVIVAVNHARLFAQMQQQALTDALTNCFNRRSFEMQLERDLHLATRMRQPVSLLLFDVDHFKEVNDTFGHDVGDLALRLIADALREELRGVDTPARYGGDEFAVILPQAGIEGATIVAERLRARIEKLSVPGLGPVTASFGLATFPIHASSRDTLFVAADRALYCSKNLGRNRVSSPPESEYDGQGHGLFDQEEKKEQDSGELLPDYIESESPSTLPLV